MILNIKFLKKIKILIKLLIKRSKNLLKNNLKKRLKKSVEKILNKKKLKFYNLDLINKKRNYFDYNNNIIPINTSNINLL